MLEIAAVDDGAQFSQAIPFLLRTGQDSALSVCSPLKHSTSPPSSAVKKVSAVAPAKRLEVERSENGESAMMTAKTSQALPSRPVETLPEAPGHQSREDGRCLASTAALVLTGIPASPYVRSAALGLEEKGVSWRLHAIGPAEISSPSYRKRHPFGRVPALEHGDFELYETQAILRYLDRIIPRPSLTPENPRAEARMNQLCGIADWYVMPHITVGISFDRLVAPTLGLPVDESRIAASIPRAEVCVAEIARLLGDQPFLAGDAISIADLLLAPHLSFFAATPESAAILTPHRMLTAWIERMNSRPALRNTTAEKLAAKARAQRESAPA